jgi:SAM-dependent methyltransferase
LGKTIDETFLLLLYRENMISSLNFLRRGNVSQFSRRRFFEKANRDWDTAWKMGLTPWDLKGTVVPAVKQSVEERVINPEKFKSVLIPGCGSGNECVYLSQKGFDLVIGLDLSDTAVEFARNQHSKEPHSAHFQQADFFAYSPKNKFDVIFDYLFFSALDHHLRDKWAKSMARLITPESGLLATLIFPLKQENDDPSKGPPYPVLLSDYEKVLLPLGFSIVQKNEVRFHSFVIILNNK